MIKSIKYFVLLGVCLMSGMTAYAYTTTPTTNTLTQPCTAGNRCLAGNAGIIPGVNFIGTTDAQDLDFRTNNAVRMRLTAPVGTGSSFFYTKVNVGVRVPNPEATLHVAGSVLFGANDMYQSHSPLAPASYSSILGGESNTISSTSVDATIGGGKNNNVDGDDSFIGGGESNKIIGSNSVIPGGYNNFAGGNAFAAGMYARAQHKYSFVRNDGSINPFTTTNTSQFLINASRGVGINTNVTSGATLTVNGTIKGKYKAANGAVGISQTVNLKNAAGNSCTMTITNGIITATSC